MDKEHLKDSLVICLIILLVIGAGLFVVNQYKNYYTTNLKNEPCSYCMALNKDVVCYKQNNKFNIPNLEVNLSDLQLG